MFIKTKRKLQPGGDQLRTSDTIIKYEHMLKGWRQKIIEQILNKYGEKN